MHILYARSASNSVCAMKKGTLMLNQGLLPKYAHVYILVISQHVIVKTCYSTGHTAVVHTNCGAGLFSGTRKNKEG